MKKLWKQLQEGLADYCCNNGFKDVILGLSGGLDSAIVSVLATETLGKHHVHAIMMKTKHTSQLSLDIANKLAELNGFDYQIMNIQKIYDDDVAFIKNYMLETPKKTVLENLQARIRGKILMTLSNQYGYLVLACGNRSEAAMGYCTLYGDTCGGLSPIGGVYKSDLYQLAEWLNTQKKLLPEEVITRAPSAELSDAQKDEDSLPPYKVLDAILKAHCDEGKKCEDIVKMGYDFDTVDWVIKQYYKMSYKRLQMPSLIPLDSGKFL